MRKKIYISGPNSGLKLHDAKKRFRKIEKYLTRMGFDALSPFNNGLKDEASVFDHMRADIKMVCQCQAMLLMRGWEDSKGCAIEKLVAETIGAEIYTEEEMMKYDNDARE